MKYSFLIKSLKYFLIFLSLIILTLLVIKGILQRGNNNKSIITFESEEINSTAQILKNPLFMGLDKKQQTFYKLKKKLIKKFLKPLIIPINLTSQK